METIKAVVEGALIRNLAAMFGVLIAMVSIATARSIATRKRQDIGLATARGTANAMRHS
jgi:hypothetical protein